MAGNRATTAIIDITGVPVVDTQVAGAFLRAAQAGGLLGAQVILTGIRPEVAQTLVGIGVSLGNIVTRSTLQDGIAFALAPRRSFLRRCGAPTKRSVTAPLCWSATAPLCWSLESWSLGGKIRYSPAMMRRTIKAKRGCLWL